MSALQDRYEALWRDSTPSEREALQEHVGAPLPVYLGGLLAAHGITVQSAQRHGGPPTSVMPSGLASYLEQQSGPPAR